MRVEGKMGMCVCIILIGATSISGTRLRGRRGGFRIIR